MAAVASAEGEADAGFFERLIHKHHRAIRTLQKRLNAELHTMAKQLHLSPLEVETARELLNDEANVLRFLRFTSYQEDAAAVMLRNCALWRKEAGVDRFANIREPVPADATDEQRARRAAIERMYRAGLFFYHGRDKLNRPIGIVRLRQHVRDQEITLPVLEEFALRQLEQGRRLLLVSKPHIVLQSVLIVDVAGVGMSNLDLEMGPFFQKLLARYYPDAITKVFIVNQGWMFSGIWSVVQRVLPAEAQARITFVSKSDELLKFIDADQLPKEYGGSRDFTYDFDVKDEAFCQQQGLFSLPPAAKPAAAAAAAKKTPAARKQGILSPPPSPNMEGEKKELETFYDAYEDVPVSPEDSNSSLDGEDEDEDVTSDSDLDSMAEAEDRHAARALRRRKQQRRRHRGGQIADYRKLQRILQEVDQRAAHLEGIFGTLARRQASGGAGIWSSLLPYVALAGVNSPGSFGLSNFVSILLHPVLKLFGVVAASAAGSRASSASSPSALSWPAMPGSGSGPLGWIMFVLQLFVRMGGVSAVLMIVFRVVSRMRQALMQRLRPALRK